MTAVEAELAKISANMGWVEVLLEQDLEAVNLFRNNISYTLPWISTIGKACEEANLTPFCYLAKEGEGELFEVRDNVTKELDLPLLVGDC